MSDESTLFNPYPGLRPFEPDENYLFFGQNMPEPIHNYLPN